MRTVLKISVVGLVVFIAWQLLFKPPNGDSKDNARTIPVHIVVTMNPDPTVLGIVWKIGPYHNDPKDVLQKGNHWGIVRKARVGDNVLVKVQRAGTADPIGGQTCRIFIRGKQQGPDISTTGYTELVCAATVA